MHEEIARWPETDDAYWDLDDRSDSTSASASAAAAAAAASVSSKKTVTTTTTKEATKARPCRLLLGLWQLSGHHGYRPVLAEASAALRRHVAAGYTTVDLADHYGIAEEVVGNFRDQIQQEGRAAEWLPQTFFFTKWVPRVGPMHAAVVHGAVQASLAKMKTDCIDLLQFHWWDYQDNRYLEALQNLQHCVEGGQIRHLGLTNFDTYHLRMILESGIHISTNQVQFSLVDQRPLRNMVPFCADHHVKLIAYGVLCGGLLSKEFLGEPEPSPKMLYTVSLKKYIYMIQAWGGWSLFQKLLACVNAIAERHGVSIANVATRWVLDQPCVGGVALGARLGCSEHMDENRAVFSLKLTEEDRRELAEICSQGNDLYKIIGDCGDEYRESKSHSTSSYCRS